METHTPNPKMPSAEAGRLGYRVRLRLQSTTINKTPLFPPPKTLHESSLGLRKQAGKCLTRHGFVKVCIFGLDFLKFPKWILSILSQLRVDTRLTGERGGAYPSVPAFRASLCPNVSGYSTVLLTVCAAWQLCLSSPGQGTFLLLFPKQEQDVYAPARSLFCKQGLLT